MTSPVASEQVSLAPAEVELGHELARYGRTVHLLKAEIGVLLPDGLDPSAAHLLVWLIKSGPTRQGELAELTFLDPSTVSRRIRQLVSFGLVERRADPGDGRASQIAATGAGTELFDRMRERREAAVHEVVGGWPADDVSELRRLLARFNDGFESYRQLGAHPAALPDPR